MTVDLSRQAAREQELAEVQIEHFRSMAQARGEDFDESLIPEPPSDWLLAPSEVLLLHHLSEPTDGRSVAAFNFDLLWNLIGVTKKLELAVDSVVDLGDDPQPGFSWIAFDPKGIVITNGDVRLDRGIDRAGLDETPPQFRGSIPASSVAGLELLTALATMPAVIYTAWVEGRQSPLRPLLPRLEAYGEEGRKPGALNMHWWPDSGISCWSQRWDYNYYGFPWVIPTVRSFK